MTGFDQQSIGILGAGLEGLSMARWLHTAHPDATVTLYNETPIEPPDLDCTLRVGAFSQTVTDHSVLIKSPGISRYREDIQALHLRCGRMISPSQVWFDRPHPRTAIVTGTKGKSTVTSLATFLANAAGVRTQAAGNIGSPLVDLLGQSDQPELVIAELSSYQLADTRVSAEAGLITNLYPEHLDWHGTEDRYYRDKLRLAEGVSDGLVLNHQQRAVFREYLPDSVSTHARYWFGSAQGWHLQDGALHRGRHCMLPRVQWRLLGDHNLLNLCAALTLLDVLNIDPLAGLSRLTEFDPLPHRLEVLQLRSSVCWVNDSISTTPHATIAAMRSLNDADGVVIVGGRDRGLDWQCFIECLREQPMQHVYCCGENGPKIKRLLTRTLPRQSVSEHADLELVAAAIAARTKTPTTVLFSPGAPSFDQYRDYRERGEHFATLARRVAS